MLRCDGLCQVHLIDKVWFPCLVITFCFGIEYCHTVKSKFFVNKSFFFKLIFQMMGPAAAAAHAQQLNEDNRQALVLFGIVIIFLLCNTPRVVLNFHEVHLKFYVILK